jgi:hypothetical protein
MEIKKLKILFNNKSSMSYKSIYMKHKTEIDIIFEDLQILDWRIKVFMLLNDVSTIPICPVCDSRDRKFAKFSIGFYDTCCKDGCNVKYQQRLSQSTCEKKYGGKSSLSSKEMQEKAKDALEKKYGVRHNFHNTEIAEKRKNTIRSKYGGLGFQSDFIRNKSIETLKDRYGVDHNSKSAIIRSKQIKSGLNGSKLEKKVKEFLVNRDINFKSQFHLKIEEYSHTFDFAIFDNENKLVCLIDCDGIYFHGYLNDANDKHIKDWYDISRLFTLPENVKFICIIESDFENGINDLLSCLNISYDDYIINLFNWCRSIGFPYPSYNDSVLNSSYKSLGNYTDFKEKSQIGFKLIRHFHPSIYHASVGNHVSPYNAWYNDELLLKSIKNRFVYKNRIDPSKILDGLNVAKIAPKVSVFKPSDAKKLITQYLNEFETIFDPFSGFSGRMLGTLSLGKKYIGFDINDKHIKESINLAKFLNKDNNVQLYATNSIESTGDYECLFTCPPYGLKEIWNENEIIKDCDEWIDICLENFKCKKYLFVVDKTEKYKEFIVDDITNNSHFSKSKECVILIEND